MGDEEEDDEEDMGVDDAMACLGQVEDSFVEELDDDILITAGVWVVEGMSQEGRKDST